MSGPMRQRVVAALRATGTVSITGLVLVLGTGPALADPAPGDSWGVVAGPDTGQDRHRSPVRRHSGRDVATAVIANKYRNYEPWPY